MTLQNRHRFFVQYMLTNGAVSIENALAFIHKLEAAQDSLTHLKTMMIEINREIGKQSFKIVQAVCEVTGEELIVWLNTKNDEISKLQIGHSPIETEYFQALMKEIIQSEGCTLLYPRCINITSTLTAEFSRENGETLLDKWTRQGYFVKIDAEMFLGARTILEFTTWLKTNTENTTCGLCSELVFVGKNCDHCDKPYHAHCLQKSLKHQGKCVTCKNNWQESTATSSESKRRPHVEESMDTTDEEDSDQDPQPSTSKRRR